MQSDPIGLGGGINTYSYVYNNPLKYIDPLGLLSIVVGGGGQVAAGPSGGGRHSGVYATTGGENGSADSGVVTTNQTVKGGLNATIGSGIYVYSGGTENIGGTMITNTTCFLAVCIAHHTNSSGETIGGGVSVGIGAPGGFAQTEDESTLYPFPDLPDLSTSTVPDSIKEEFCRQNPNASNCQNHCPKN